MDAFQFEKAIDKLEESPEVSKLLKDLGVTKKLKPKGAEDTVVELKPDGVQLTFQKAAPKTSQLKLTGVQFLSGGSNGYKPYTGTLPRGLKWSDSKKDVYTKLGKPTLDMDEDLRLDHWVKDGVQTSVKYAVSLNELKYVAVGIPYEEDDDE